MWVNEWARWNTPFYHIRFIIFNNFFSYSAFSFFQDFKYNNLITPFQNTDITQAHPYIGLPPPLGSSLFTSLTSKWEANLITLHRHSDVFWSYHNIALHGTLRSHPLNDDVALASYLLPCDARVHLTVSLISGLCNLSTTPSPGNSRQKPACRNISTRQEMWIQASRWFFFLSSVPCRNNYDHSCHRRASRPMCSDSRNWESLAVRWRACGLVPARSAWGLGHGWE